MATITITVPRKAINKKFLIFGLLSALESQYIEIKIIILPTTNAPNNENANTILAYKSIVISPQLIFKLSFLIETTSGKDVIKCIDANKPIAKYENHATLFSGKNLIFSVYGIMNFI